MTDLQTRTTKHQQRRLSAEQARTVLVLASVDRSHRRSTTARIALAAGLATAGLLAFWAITDGWPNRLIIASVAVVAVASLVAFLAGRFWSSASEDSIAVPLAKRAEPANGSIHPFSNRESSTKISKL